MLGICLQLINVALDISWLFEKRADVIRRHTRFTSREPPASIIFNLEHATRRLGGSVQHRDATRSSPPFPPPKGGITWLLSIVRPPQYFMPCATKLSCGGCAKYQGSSWFARGAPMTPCQMWAGPSKPASLHSFKETPPPLLHNWCSMLQLRMLMLHAQEAW